MPRKDRTMNTNTPSAKELHAENKRQDRNRAIKALRAERDRLDGYKERAKRAQRRFDKTVALAISGRPKAPDWAFHPGPMTTDEVMTAARLTSKQLVALMNRYQRG
jgi:hypothetical protein